MESNDRSLAPDHSPSTEKSPSASSVPSLVNWDLAASTAAAMVAPGPKMSAREIRDAVADLRAAADASVAHVHRITGLEAARDLRDSDVLIVDRASWARANSQSFSVLMGPALEHLATTRPEQLEAANTALGGTLTGAQLGAVLAFLSSKVLGQYDPFAALGGVGKPGGRLLLVAPNIITLERELNVDPDDFRLWVCLHEQTHRVQFAAAPWLREHMLEQISQLSNGMMDKAETLSERLGTAVKALTARKDGKDGNDGDGVPQKPADLLSLLQDPEDKERLSHLTAVMSLLEGHANVVMDAVDSSIVPSVKTIRQRFNNRGAKRGWIDRFLRQVLGLDAKMRQYSDGARFVRAVTDQVGMEGFNRVWERAENLPSEAEIHSADLWITRMGL
ncbi:MULTISPECIES: zinc-dependent metalloprotease [unclassified Arthrobacter]|uniref:zinc-dependent metalloprotease n=1 Tax=unclassified Arthrobacter TaxID=235627 RepID=UPI001D1338FF|nr:MULTISPECIES: zinc-dependent metalloprotease [unclassified Arthrobacter]MCC3275797.1 zinc-dependent metalloprotease [Arthrobacter sp. zg-Y20]MCC3278778.1 zinc-dependent metalloprotease [Arthrobacter sp. zg-Y40]MCC9177152.1 zinc-dependent metalloprotease [Arthrobacter sp. zg-Y750]MDK1315954.1 zinc-dependent metalloprotease [Arthrobacter sp. zg.Y20]MDK1326149.1 zinc-dependent metalloprotease [Arthrobacter sp. zg-Y1143]